jgi:hypothetical protein
MLQNKEAMKEMLNKNPDLKKQLEELVKQWWLAEEKF